MEHSTQTQSKLFKKDFTLMVIGQIISLFGNATLRFALSMWVLDATGSAAIFAAILAVSMIPTVLLSPFGGILADRVSRRNIMVGLDFLTAASILIFSFIFRQTSSTFAIAVIMILLSVIQSFYQPSVQSAIPSLVEGEHLMAANGIVVQVNALAMLLGPILGGILFGFFGIYPILYVSGFCFFCSAVMECFMHIPFIHKESKEHLLLMVKNDFSEAVSFLIHKQKSLCAMLFLIAGINLFLSSMMTVGMPYLIKIYLGMSNQLYGLAEGAMGLGSILGGLLSGVIAKKMKFTKSYRLLFCCSVAVFPMGFAVITNRFPFASYLLVMVSVLFIMCFATLFSVFGQTVMQRLTPEHLLGKVASVVTVMCTCAFPIGQAMYGVLFDKAGNHAYIVVLASAVISVIIALLSKKVIQSIRES